MTCFVFRVVSFLAKSYQEQIEKHLRTDLPHPPLGRGLHEAMNYSLQVEKITWFGLGCTQFVPRGENPLRLPCRLKLSAQQPDHDDLPAMDDSDLRRGVPLARAFDEATAILSGDALIIGV